MHAFRECKYLWISRQIGKVDFYSESIAALHSAQNEGVLFDFVLNKKILVSVGN